MRSTWPSGTSGWSPGRSAIRDLSADEHFARYREDPFTPRAERDPVVDDVDVIVAGGGIAGVVVGAKLREAGIERIRVVDTAGGFGGTWYWNRYPGVMCDVESYVYLPMLEELDYVPTTRYAFGEEIRLHLEAIAERYELVDDALFHTGVTRAEWDEEAARWRITTDRGDQLTCRWYVLATGILNLLKLPAIPGMEQFAGHSFHTARWDYAYTGGAPGGEPMTELGDKVVGLIGTGATGIQALPPLAAAAEHVYVFQRTPSAVGIRGNRPTDPDFAERREPGWQQSRMDNFQSVMLGRPVDADLTDDGWTHHYAAVHNPPRWKGMTTEEYVLGSETLDFGIMEEHRTRVAEIVSDPGTAEILKPYYRYLCKRPCFHDEYLDAYNLPNVTLVDCPAGFDRVTEQGPVIGGKQYEVDCLIYGTGFEPETTPLPRRIGQELVGTRWAHPRGEVDPRPRHPVRDDDPRVPEPVRDAGPRPAGRRDRELHAPRRARRPVRGGGGLPPRPAGREGVRRERRRGGRLGREDRRQLRRRQPRDGRLHAVAHQQRGQPAGHGPAQRQLRTRVRRLLRVPRPARGVAGGRRVRRARARHPPRRTMTDRPVVVVTGGGGGIGAAVAEELGRGGWHVVTVDPLVSLDGSERLPEPEETTAGHIVAAGGSAQASSASVTDRDGIDRLFGELAAEHGRLDAVVNVAGISRPTSFAGGTEDDWRSVLQVHLDGYLNVLGAALPLMAAAGRGRIVGVTSGSGWRAADTGAYGCAKRAVASLTWQLGAEPPEGVTVNALSPIAVTRMVTAALGRAPATAAKGGSRATGGLSLGSMPEPADIGPLGAHLASEAFGWCSGEIVFGGGSEVAIVERPRLLELVRTEGVGSLAHLLEAVGPGVLARAEVAQAAGGGSNPRFGPAFDDAGGELAGPAAARCAVVSDRPALAAAVTAALEARGVAVGAEPADADAVVVAMAGPPESGAGCSMGADPGGARPPHGPDLRRTPPGPVAAATPAARSDS